MKLDYQETDKFLAVRYPHLKNPRLLLEKLNRLIELLGPINGGNLETLIRWSGGVPVWDDITVHLRELMREETRANK